ncbi:MAG: vitamin B12-dependent ribonucleotide reductase, partial [Streptosporangiaceae bacterium]|nr:vitamin B12-dependent ribonucleotide reductase [Streptosporangiaceae bacterium]
LDTVDAKGLLRKVAHAAWECADPGIQYDDTINDWHTCPESGRITASNPCREYVHLDNSSCNLASINLLKFLRDDDTFDAERFAKITELIITAMDISITFADFPTEKIAAVTRAYRQLGIGYANLGALLMATGHAYDSEGGRAIAAAITSLMTGTAYKRSAELAGVVGPYDGYERNAEPHKRVIRKHAAASADISPVGTLEREILDLASRTWQECTGLGEANGYRNAQASLLAPTGTIGLMMDCDTTGIEPDLALVKFKKLVGGGSMQIVNQTVPRALKNLGYQPEQVEAITEYVAEHGHVVNAPGLRPEHYEVFDCAMGERAISPMGHVRMIAAVQPLLSGSVSKTVNMPESATVEDIEKIYFEGWKLGLKALAIYRDNCKVGQPLSVARKKPAAEQPPAPTTAAPAATAAAPAAPAPEPHEHRPVRRRLPRQRPATVTRFSVAGAEGYMTASSYPDDGVGEVFLKLGKQGSTLAGVMDAFSIAISVGLQYGIPLESYVAKFTNMRFEPAGLTDDPDIRIASSVMDYIFRRLALDHLPYEDRAGLGILSAAERAGQLTGEDPAALPDDVDPVELAQSAAVESAHTERAVATPQPPASPTAASAPTAPASTGPHSSTELIESHQGRTADAPLCLTCGTKMRPAGSCYVCEGCGSTSGCS